MAGGDSDPDISLSEWSPADYLTPVATKGMASLHKNPLAKSTGAQSTAETERSTDQSYDYIGVQIPAGHTDIGSARQTRYHKASDGKWSCVRVGVVVVVVLVSVLGLVIAVTSLAFQLTTSTKQDAAINAAQMMISAQADRIQVLQEMLENSTPLSPAMSTTTPPPATTTAPVTTPTTSTMNPAGMEEANVTLSGVNLFQDCTTRIETNCTVTPGVGIGNDFRLCITDFITINRLGEYVLNINCLLVVETLESNPLIATLDIADNLGGCRCYVPTLNLVNLVTHPVTCGLQVTRCTIPTNITSRIV